MLLVCGADDAKAFAVESGPLVALAAAPHLRAFAVDEGRGVALGYDVHGTLFAFDGERFVEVLKDRRLHGLAWHPELGAVVTLLSGPARMSLAMVSGDRLVDVRPAIASTTYRSGGRLGVTGDRRIVYFGGQDFDRSGRPTNASLVSDPGGTLLRSDDLGDDVRPVLGADTTSITTASRIALANHSTLEVLTPSRESAWREVAERVEQDFSPGATGPAIDSRYVNFAASDERVFLLDAKGALWTAATGQHYVTIAKPEPGPGSHYAHRVALAWDPPSQRVIVFGGIESNSTWVASEHTHGFLEIRVALPPPHGIGSMVSTPLGAYLLVDGELHRFDQGGWVAVAAGLPGYHLFHDPRRERLLVGGWDHAAKQDALWVIDAGGVPRVAAHLPAEHRLGTENSGGVVAALDPAHDRFLIFSERDAFVLPLAAIEVASRGLPTKPLGLPRQRLATAPPAWTRPAARLVAGAEVRAPRITLEGELIAIVPAHPEALPLPVGIVALAISESREWWKSSQQESWKIGGQGGGYHARFVGRGELPEPVTGVIVSAGTARALRVEAYREVAPDRALQVDSQPDGIDANAWGSKLGGFPRYIQADPTACWEGAPLRFAVQLSSDLVSVADVGKLYVWISEEPSPRAYVVMQSH